MICSAEAPAKLLSMRADSNRLPCCSKGVAFKPRREVGHGIG